MKAISFLALILLASCDFFDSFKTDKYHYMPSEYKSDLKVHDTVFFSGNSTIDTFFVYKIDGGFNQIALSGDANKGPYERWEFDYHYYYNRNHRLSDCILSINSLSGKKGDFFGESGLPIPNCDNAYSIWVGSNTNCIPNIGIADTVIAYSEILPVLSINKIEYQNVFHFILPASKSDISDIFYHYKKGIVKYAINGNTFEYMPGQD